MNKFFLVFLCCFCFKSSAAEVASLKDFGFFSSSLTDPIFDPNLLSDLASILDSSKTWEKNHEDSGFHAQKLAWNFDRIIKSEASLTFSQFSSTDESHMPEPVKAVLEGFFRFIPEGEYAAEFLLSSDMEYWAQKRESLAKSSDQAQLFAYPAEALPWHQDKFYGLKLPYRYLGFAIISAEGLSDHDLELGWAKKDQLFLKSKASSADFCEATKIKTIKSTRGATYFIDQDWTKDEQVVVHRHNGFNTFISNTKPQAQWIHCKSEDLANFLTNKFPKFTDFEENNVASVSYKRPKRQKIILRILELPKASGT